MDRVALMGLGTMGSGMAGCLLEAGFPLTVWNRNPARAQPFADAGATIAATPRAAASEAHVVISMVADDEASRAVWMGESGALAGARPAAVLIESSTVSPGHVETLAAAAAKRNCQFLDAPVTGSKGQAAAGDLLFLVGGDRAVLERVRRVFDAMGRDVVHVGSHASGARLKLINNFMCGVQAAALAEAMALIEKSDLDRTTALAVLLNGAPGSPLVKAVASRMATRDYTVNFSLALMAKDLMYVQREAARQQVVLTTAAAAGQVFHQAIDAGHGQEDFAAVVEPLRSGSR